VSASLSPTAAAAVVPAGSRVALRGTVRPGKRSALLLAYRLRGDTYRRIARVPVRVRRGRVTARFRLARAGAYRLRLAVLADARNLSGRSPYLEARAGVGAAASGR
jgi:hypothetical protein